jgi:hypothetical protein
MLILEVRMVVVDIGSEWVVVDIGGESGLLLILDVRGGPSHLQYQQPPTFTSNINNNPRSPIISTTTHSHLQYIQQTTLTSNINNNPLSPPISTTTLILEVKGGCC